MRYSSRSCGLVLLCSRKSISSPEPDAVRSQVDGLHEFQLELPGLVQETPVGAVVETQGSQRAVLTLWPLFLAASQCIAGQVFYR